MRKADGRMQIMNPVPVTVIKPDGRSFENVEAGVHSEKIFFNDPNLPLEAGDIVERSLPSGLVDKFEIVDPGFRNGSHRLPDHFRSKVKRWVAPKELTDAVQTNITYNLHGQNSKVNIGSVDNSTIYGGNTQSLYQELRRAIEEGVPAEEQSSLLESVGQLENAPENEKKEAFGALVAKAATYLEILAPFIKVIASNINS